MSRSAQSEAEATQTKAAKAELSRNYDSAFTLYIKAAESFLHLSRSTSQAQAAKTKWQANARKCMERAEKIKAFVSKAQASAPTAGVINDVIGKATDLSLTPVTVDYFAPHEQHFVLSRGAHVNGLIFPSWDESPQQSHQFTDPRWQPALSTEQMAVAPIWRSASSRGDNTRCISLHADSTLADSLAPQDIIQHIVTDCSVCASISVCLEHRRRFNSDVSFKWFITGEFVLAQAQQIISFICCSRRTRRPILHPTLFQWCLETTIDDKLPYHPELDIPMCMSTASHGQAKSSEHLWPSLLEKGYMKVMGGYDFPGSNSSIDLNVIAGWIPEHIEIKSSSFEREKTWDRIVTGFKKGHCLITLGTGVNNHIAWRGVQLLASHSYAVIDVSETAEDRWLTVLDSWLPTSELDGAQDTSRVLNMPWADVLNVFDGIYASWDPRLWAETLTFHGMWNRRGHNSPSGSHHLQLTYESGHYADTHDHEIWILLTRHLSDTHRSGEYISLSVHHDDELTTHKVAPTDLAKMAVKSTYTNSTHVLVRTRVPPSLSSGRLSIIGLYDGESSDVGFTITAYATGKLSWLRIRDPLPYHSRLGGQWSTKNAGGNCNHPTFMLNPQYHLTIHPSKVGAPGGKASVVLAMKSSKDIPINIAVVWSQGERITEVSHIEVACATGAYSYGLAWLAAELTVGSYTVILSPFEPLCSGPFSIDVECTNRFDLEPIPQEGAGMYSKPLRGAWSAGSAAGSPSFKRYSSNPIFELHLPAASHIMVRLQLLRPSVGIPVNLTIFPASKSRASLQRHITTSGGYNDAVCGVVTPQVALKAGKYWIIPSTYNAGIEMAFSLMVHSTMKGFTVTEINPP